MSDQFIGELRVFSFGFPPRGWVACNGQVLPINQNQALFALLGTTFGGDGRQTFALPNLQGRVPVHSDGGARFALGSLGGEPTHALTVGEIPQHGHMVSADDAPPASDGENPAPNRRLSRSSGADVYGQRAVTQPMSASMIASSGGGQGHQNMQPFLAVNVCIAITGIFPSPN
jgi:microcystin-dependent protein